MELNDQALLALLATDIQQHYQQLVTHYQHRLYAFAFRLTGNAQDAEDIVQEALVSAYISLENYPVWRIQTLKLQAWLYKVTLHVFNHYTRGTRLHVVPLPDTEDNPELHLEDEEEKSPEMLFEGLERRQELEALVATLPPHYRVAVTCYYFEELSYQEIADLLEQPLGTIKSSIHRGIRLLRKQQSIPAGKECTQWNQKTANRRKV